MLASAYPNVRVSEHKCERSEQNQRMRALPLLPLCFNLAQFVIATDNDGERVAFANFFCINGIDIVNPCLKRVVDDDGTEEMMLQKVAGETVDEPADVVGVVDVMVGVNVGKEDGAGAGRGETGGIDTTDFQVHGETVAITHPVHCFTAAGDILDGQRLKGLVVKDDPHRLRPKENVAIFVKDFEAAGLDQPLRWVRPRLDGDGVVLSRHPLYLYSHAVNSPETALCVQIVPTDVHTVHVAFRGMLHTPHQILNACLEVADNVM